MPSGAPFGHFGFEFGDAGLLLGDGGFEGFYFVGLRLYGFVLGLIKFPTVLSFDDGNQFAADGVGGEGEGGVCGGGQVDGTWYVRDVGDVAAGAGIGRKGIVEGAGLRDVEVGRDVGGCSRCVIISEADEVDGA